MKRKTKSKEEKLQIVGIIGGIHKPRPVKEVPKLILIKWQVYEVESELWEGKSRHIVGWNITEGSGRVSSEIKKFDKRTMIATTRSGRIYKLEGEPGACMDALYVWGTWCSWNKINQETIVTVSKEYLKKSKRVKPVN